MDQNHRLGQIVNVVLAVLLVLGLILTVYAILQVKSIGTEAAGKGKYISGTITMNESNPVYGQAVTFSVSTNARGNDVYGLWVANKCSQGGVAVLVAHQPVQSGKAGPFNLNWPGGGSASCTAYVWFFPDSETPMKGASVTYNALAQ